MNGKVSGHDSRLRNAENRTVLVVKSRVGECTYQIRTACLPCGQPHKHLLNFVNRSLSRFPVGRAGGSEVNLAPDARHQVLPVLKSFLPCLSKVSRLGLGEREIGGAPGLI